MKFEIDLKDKKYSLKVDDSLVFESDKLSDMLGVMERISGVIKNHGN
jgi:hypothetical protein